MMIRNIFLILAFSLLFFGCSEQIEKVDVPADILDFGGRGDYIDAGKSNQLFKTVDQMVSNDVIVAVNGYPLTKELFDRMMCLRASSYINSGANFQTAMSKVNDFRQMYPKMFMGHRLLIDRALELKLVTPDEVRNHVADAVRKVAKFAKKPVRKLLAQFKGKENLYFYELAVNYVVNKIVQKEIPPLMQVTPSFVSNVQETVAADNAAARMTNEMFRTQLMDLRRDILSRKITFEKASEIFSYVDGNDTTIFEGGKWGTFSQGDFDNPETERIVFSLRPGEISEVLEEENGYQVLRVDVIIPAKKAEDGSVTIPEQREISHIWRSKIPFLLTQDDVALSSDLKRQMQMRAINRYIMDQATNGVNKIVYPHGRILFK